jgi:hypothetical protein
MNEKQKEDNSFWKSIPGTITKLTGLVVAIGSLITILDQTELISIWTEKENSNNEKNSFTTDGCFTEKACYIICESAFDKKDEAVKRVIELGKKGYNGKAAYLWIPDYDCLRIVNLYQVYIGPFSDLSNARSELCQYNKKFSKTTYGLKVCDGTKRFEFRCSD